MKSISNPMLLNGIAFFSICKSSTQGLTGSTLVSCLSWGTSEKNFLHKFLASLIKRCFHHWNSPESNRCIPSQEHFEMRSMVYLSATGDFPTTAWFCSCCRYFSLKIFFCSLCQAVLSRFVLLFALPVGIAVVTLVMLKQVMIYANSPSVKHVQVTDSIHLCAIMLTQGPKQSISQMEKKLKHSMCLLSFSVGTQRLMPRHLLIRPFL